MLAMQITCVLITCLPCYCLLLSRHSSYRHQYIGVHMPANRGDEEFPFLAIRERSLISDTRSSAAKTRKTSVFARQRHDARVVPLDER